MKKSLAVGYSIVCLCVLGIAFVIGHDIGKHSRDGIVQARYDAVLPVYSPGAITDHLQMDINGVLLMSCQTARVIVALYEKKKIDETHTMNINGTWDRKPKLVEDEGIIKLAFSTDIKCQFSEKAK